MKDFIITIDTESDNQWETGRAQTTENARFLPRFQSICEQYGLKPVYLVDYSMAQDAFLNSFLKQCLANKTCEVGMHLHAWDTPPNHKYDSSPNGRPYLIEYPVDVMEEKISVLTKVLEERFETDMISHRAGRWAMNSQYFHFLERFGYLVDCSYTPGVNWNQQIGFSKGGSDYRKVSLTIERIGGTSLIEVPMTVRKVYGKRAYQSARGKLKGVAKSVLGANIWLRPSICGVEQIETLIRDESAKGCDHLEFMMHSSEFMPGGSPYFQDEEAIERLYKDLVRIFSLVKSEGYSGATLAEIAKKF